MPAPASRAERVDKAVEAWTRHLVDLGGRNTLLWYRDLAVGTLELTTAHPSGLSRLLAGQPTKLSDVVRQPDAFNDARRRTRAVAAKARELLEERGIATCYLAVGMASWHEPKASRPPAAPVLLRACQIKRVGAAGDDFVLDIADDTEVNPVLAHYLQSEQDLSIDTDELAELAGPAGTFDPTPAFRALAEQCATLPEFVIHPRLVVGTFSYAKLPMVADLRSQPERLAAHDIVAALAGDPDALAAVRGRDETSAAAADLQVSDGDPEREHLILDADASQQGVIQAVASGANLVVKGPPGTGKSQTIANLIATLIADGQRVLFVAEKRAAIDAVTTRLANRGLSELVLDLYDRSTSRSRVATEIGTALEKGVATRGPLGEPIRNELLSRRQALADHVQALHQIREPWGVSAYAAQEAIAALNNAPAPPRSQIRIRGAQLQQVSRAEADTLRRELADAGALGAWTTDTDGDPWYGADIRTSQEAVEAQERTSALASGGLTERHAQIADVFATVRLPGSDTADDWGRILRTVSAVRDSLEVFRPEIFDIPLDPMVSATAGAPERRAEGVDMGWLARWRMRRQARRLLRPGSPPADLHAALVAAREQRGTWQAMAGGGGRPELPADLDLAQDAFDALVDDLNWLGRRLRTTAAGGDLMHLPLPALRARLEDLAAHPDRLAVIPKVRGTLDSLDRVGLSPLVNDLAERLVPPGQAADELDFVWWTSVLEDIALRDPRYGAHEGDSLRATAAAYVRADREHLAEAGDRVRAVVADHLRQVLRERPHQEALVRAEATKRRRHRSMRDLLSDAAPVVTAAKPCFVMSPLLVASLLPPGEWFDVVIFDEASQIPPAQAVSAISRGRRVVVAGDDRQLPPTTFFTTASEAGDGEPDEGLTDGFESILDVLSAALPVRTLRWHYRSRDERLIAFSNEHLYGGELVTFPGAGTDPVLTFDYLEHSSAMPDPERGVETSTDEVNRVVELALEHARIRTGESLGVITFGIVHAEKIEEALRRALVRVARSEPGVAEFFDEDRPEPFFIKNIERVQGDERDAVILSVGYGKTPHGRVLHRFGPLNIEGGERRLNVAATRARIRMHVVSSLAAEDLAPERLKATGAQLLRAYLAYAASGGELNAPTQSGAPSQVVSEFAVRLRDSGLDVIEGYGSSHRPIDLVVNAPDGSRLAIESDGPVYAAMPITRERDRLRPEHLERLGWTPVRVWSTDLFRDPARDVSRVVALTGAGHVGTDDRGETAAAPPQTLPRPRRVLEQTSDDTDAGWGEPTGSDAHDRWLQEQRPPHWE